MEKGKSKEKESKGREGVGVKMAGDGWRWLEQYMTNCQ